MQTRTKLGLQTLRRAHAFLVQQEFQTALGDLAPQVAALQSVIEQLEAHATDQEARRSAARSATDARLASLQRLRREYLRPIAHIARTLLADDPEVRRAYRIPKSNEAEGLLQVANAFAERVAGQRDRFVAQGLAPDFVERLQRAVEDYYAVHGQRGAEVARRVAATRGLRVALSRGRAILTLIDLMLAPRLASTPDRLAEWRSISRVMRRGQAGASNEASTSRERVLPIIAMHTPAPSAPERSPVTTPPDERAPLAA